METCPHCFNFVLPKDDRSCPSCLQSIDDLEDANTLLTTFIINEKMKLPEICCICGISTNRKKIFRERCDPAIWHPEDKTLYEYTRIGLVKRDIAPTVEIKLPLCRKCEKGYKIILRYVEYENHEMTFIVSKVFCGKAVIENNL
jgi:hypothetical protein